MNDEVLVLPDEARMPLDEERTLLELCLSNHVRLTHACGGHAKCSTCRVFVREGGGNLSPRTAAESAMAEKLRLADRVRLACQTRARGPATVRRMILDHEDESFVVEAMVSGKPEQLGEEIDAAILFCDIRGFTPLAARLEPYDTIYVLNRFHALANALVSQHGGEVVNTMGDGFLALFRDGGPAENCDHAVSAAVALLAAMPQLGLFLEEAFGETLRVGIGIHFGSMIAGMTGHGASAKPTVIGGSVNRASRIESATKALGASLLVSDAVRERTAGRHSWTSAGVARLAGVGDEELFTLADASPSAG